MSFAKRLQIAMDNRQITQTQLSGMTGISKASISQYLAGKNTPRDDRLQLLADALEMDPDILKNGVPPPPGAPPTVVDEIILREGLRNVPVAEAARIMDKSQQFIRVALQRQLVPFGFAVRMPGGKWSYYISPRKLYDFLKGVS